MLEGGFSVIAAAINIADIIKAIKEKQVRTEKELKDILPPEGYNFIPLFLS